MREFEDGVYDISNEEYHASSAVSRSKLMALRKSPYHYRHPKEFKGSSATALGSLVHCLLLEPHLLTEQFAFVPEINRRTKIGRQQYDAFLLAHENKTIVSEEQVQQARDMVANMLKNHDISCLIESDDIEVEQSIYWTDKDSGIQFKCRPDGWLRRKGVIIDVKTTNDASPWAFSNSAYKFGYFLQTAMVAEAMDSIGEPMKAFFIVAVENVEPYVPAVYVVEQETINIAKLQFKELARKLANCEASQQWSDYGTNLLTMPKYAGYADE